MKTTNKSSVELFDFMGNDLSVCNAARVSFDKVSEYDIDGNIQDKDVKLINYLAKHNHWSPFAHTTLKFRISTPIFIARQLGKHQVGLVWNEVSRRYVDEEPTFFFPDKWRKRAESVKQGSSEEEYKFTNIIHPEHLVNELSNYYIVLLQEGVAPEQARMILPQNMMTTFIWTGSLMAFFRVYKERTNPHAQKEIQDVAKDIWKDCKEIFPVSCEALEKANGIQPH